MTLETIEDSLVNGFHDAVIMEMSRDYEKGTASLRVDILIDLPPDAPDEANRWRCAELKFTGVTLWTVETPDPDSAFPHPGGIWFVPNSMKPDVWSDAILARLPKDCLRYSLFVLDWHSNIHIAATDVEFRWL